MPARLITSKLQFELDDEGKPILTEGHYTVDPETGCWIFEGEINSFGYGFVRVTKRHNKPAREKRWRAHVLMFEQRRGMIPLDLFPDHLCRCRCCINPAHIEPVTHRENTLRGIGPAANNARKTACYKGHQFTADNTYRQRLPNGQCQRYCLECRRERDKKRYMLNPGKRRATSYRSRLKAKENAHVS